MMVLEKGLSSTRKLGKETAGKPVMCEASFDAALYWQPLKQEGNHRNLVEIIVFWIVSTQSMHKF